MLRGSDCIHGVESFKLGPIIHESPALTGTKHEYWHRRMELKAEFGRSWRDFSLFSNVSEEALMTEDEKAAKSKEDGFADARLKTFVHNGEPSGIARIAD